MQKWPELNSVADKGCIWTSATNPSLRECGCAIGGKCWRNGEVNPANPCE